MSDKTELEYEWKRYGQAWQVSNEFFRHLDVEFGGPVFAGLLRQFETIYVKWSAAERRMTEYRWPATWWDAFKERWFTKRMLRRWPVQYRYIELSEVLGLKRLPDDEMTVRYRVYDSLPKPLRFE